MEDIQEEPAKDGADKRVIIVGSITGNTNTLAGNVPPKVPPFPGFACYLPPDVTCWLHHRQHQHPRRQCAAQGAPHSSVSPCDTSSICQQNTSTSPAICRPRFRAPFVPHVDSDMCPMAILLATPIPSRQPAAQKTPCCFFHQCRTCVYFCHLPLGVCSTS